ncbi:peptidylprolyl isomerase [Parachitinimonas caeni]|uniref:peptidylprolyl isomerase n=1 Tax=Parachitinimonas caeni TaxID=3031301 RepID=A0ABT7E1B5_9NEIS|nr:peptidyl-prolyl cis-trans isomerase [Parachitinimonas caeni]MDK2126110.1 peptidyl-prolyl cis-trans isomerase [Parachitinimonas caeni]
MRRPLIVAAVSLLAAVGGQAAVRYDLAANGVVATIDGEPMSAASLGVLHKIAARRDIRTPLSKVLASVIDNRLLGDYARQNFRADQLYPSTHVGFPFDVQIEDQLVATLRRVYGREIETALAAEPTGSLTGTITRPFSLKREILAGIVQSPGGLQLSDQLSQAQEQQARATELLRYRFGDEKEASLSLWDVYRRLNVQARQAVRGLDLAQLEQFTREALSARYVQYWVRQNSGLSPSDLRQLRRYIEDRSRRGEYLRLVGLEADMHYDSAHIKQLAAEVTPAEIRAYYDANKPEFRRIEKVRARHLHVADETTAQKLYEALNAGADFGGLAKQHSLASDRDTGGDLGWITHREGLNWLEQTAYALPQGLGKPIRRPQLPGMADGWEIVLVEEKVEGYQAPESESVRYVASQAIARKKALGQFKTLREQLYKTADIRLNPTYISGKLDTP